VGFRGDLALVRDARAPVERRVLAWRRCVRRYAPFGYAATMEHLRERYGSLNDPVALHAAADALEHSRRVWLIEVAEFAARRRAAKRDGQRRAHRSEVARWRYARWPGGAEGGAPAPGSAPDRPVATEFLARYGMTEWTPEPVNHRRRARRLPPVPSRWDGVWSSVGCAGTLALIAVAVCAWKSLAPPRIFWSAFVVTGVVLLPVLAWREVRGNDVRRREVSAARRRIADAAALAERRHALRRRRDFDAS